MKQLTSEELERMAIFVEECSECQQIAMKIIRHGSDSYNPFDSEKTPNHLLLAKEVGDLMYALSLLVTSGDLSEFAIEQSKETKGQRIKPYLHFNDPL